MFLNLAGPVIADTVYADGVLAAKDVSVSFPAITPITADYSAMGTMSLPVTGQIESMEAAITKIGVDKGLGKLVRAGRSSLELRWVQDVLKADGTSGPEGCKAFLTCLPKTIPGITLEMGSRIEVELTFEVFRYQLFVAGAELWLVDRLSQIYRFDGKDYYQEISSLL